MRVVVGFKGDVVRAVRAVFGDDEAWCARVISDDGLRPMACDVPSDLKVIGLTERGLHENTLMETSE